MPKRATTPESSTFAEATALALALGLDLWEASRLTEGGIERRKREIEGFPIHNPRFDTMFVSDLFDNPAEVVNDDNR